MFFKALTMGLGNANAYNVKIDKNVVATLRPGEETEIELPPGSHTVVFKAARSMGVKSNKLTVNIDINKDYIRIKGNRFLSWIPQTREKSKLYFTDTRIKYQE